MYGWTGFQVWRQRHEEILRDAESRRVAREVRAGRSRRFLSTLRWEIERCGGRLVKALKGREITP